MEISHSRQTIKEGSFSHMGYPFWIGVAVLGCSILYVFYETFSQFFSTLQTFKVF